MNTTLRIACLLLLALPLPAQQAAIQEEPRVFKTYPFSGPDPSPIMTRSSIWGRGLRLYPYFSFDGLSTAGKDQQWNVVRLENPYIQAFVMPAEGGKLIGAVEKSTNKEFIYFNHVMKFRHIALRGPWTSGGVELNFGIVGHTPATASPVDYLTRKNPDGSVTCFVGNLDLPSRTWWRVAFTVFPDKAYVQLNSLWYNPQPLNQSYYVWMNAANKLSPGLEFIFPGNRYIGHNYNVPSKPWPVDASGRNLALYKEHDDSDDGSFFIHGALQDFSGGYWHDANFGYGHWALHEEVPGQKFFRWSLSRAGAIWTGLLTDTDGPYFEPQSGRLLDQNDHEFFAPYTTDRWSEIYFPYKQIGPMVKANPYGALNVRNTPQGLTVSLCALQKLDETLIVRAAGREIFRDRLSLLPMQVYEKQIPSTVKSGDLRVEIGDKLSYTGDPNDGLLHRPLNFHEFDESTTEGIYLSAERQDKERNYDLALDKYLSVLKREPLHVRALTRVAELYTRRAEYRRALEYAHKALDQSMYDAGANFIYAIAARRLDQLTDAKETLGWAARSMQFRSSAYSELGSIYLAEGNLDRARHYLESSLKYDADNIRSLQVLAIVHRLAGRPPRAHEALDKILNLDPLNHAARFEQYLLDPSPAARANFTSMIRNELPHETYLELAVEYANLKRDADALRLLSLAPEQAQIRYWQAWLQRENPASTQLLEQAAALSPYLVFPFREESIPVFEWAAKTNPEDWKAKYYLGLVYWGLRRADDARRLFSECGDRPDYAPLYISRAYLERESSPEKALADFERAKSVGSDDWRNWRHLAAYSLDRGLNAKALGLAVEAARQFPAEDQLKVLLARAYLANGRFEDCYNVLKDATILPFEGQRDVHALYVQSQIGLALQQMKKGQFAAALKYLDTSREYPERLGTGKPGRPDYRLQDALAMLCYENSGQSAQAAEAWQRLLARADVGQTSRPAAGLQAGPRPQSLPGREELRRWYRTVLPTQPELQALSELTRSIRPR